MASGLPFGPAWVSAALHGDNELPLLVKVVVTRRLAGGVLLPHVALVDRTCLGIKNAFVMKPAGEAEVAQRVASMGRDGDPLKQCEPLLAQSVVFHALDYARSLGFGPHPDFEQALFGPRPELLLDTPLARPSRPFFASGPDDDVDAVLRRLDGTVGPDNYEFVMLAEQASGWFENSC